MTDKTELVNRLLAHAAIHDAGLAHDDEQRQRADDLLAAAAALSAQPAPAAQAEPVARAVQIGDDSTPENRLATMLTEALGPFHPALDDLAALVLAATHAAPSVPEGWCEFVARVAAQKPEKPDYWSSCGQCERNASDAEDLLAAAAPQPGAPTPKGDAHG